MNNDLISREALKKCAIPCEIHNGALTDLCVPLYQIDNAPAVDIKDQIAGAYNEGYMCGNKEAEKARPQAFINGIVELISKNGITTADELLEALKGGAE